MNGLASIDPESKIAVVQPGIVLDRLRDAAEKHHLTYAPDPATHSRCTLGGMIGNNSCGVHGLLGGKTVDNVESLDVVLYDGTRMTVGRTSPEQLQSIVRAGGRKGEIYAGLARIRDRYADLVRAKFPRIPRRVSGYNLDELLPENGFNVARALVGSEGTCATVLSATLNLTASPPFRVLTVLGFDDPFVAADSVPLALEHKPIGLEGFDHLLVQFMRRKGLALKELDQLPPGVGFLLVEMGAWSAEEAQAKAEMLGARLPKLAQPTGCAYLHSGRSGERLVCARVGAGRGGVCAGRAGSLGGLGRCRRSAGEARRLSAQHLGVDGGVWLLQPAVWTLRAGMRAHAHQLRLPQRRGTAQVSRVPRSRDGCRA